MEPGKREAEGIFTRVQKRKRPCDGRGRACSDAATSQGAPAVTSLLPSASVPPLRCHHGSVLLLVIWAAPLAPCLVLTPAFQFSSSSVIFPNKIYVKSFHELRFPCCCTDTAVGRSGPLLICPQPRQVCERRTRLAAPEAGRSSPASRLSQRRSHFCDLAVLTGPLSPGTPGSLPLSAQQLRKPLLTSRWAAAPSLLSQPQESDPHGDSGFYFCFHHEDLAGGLSVNLHHHTWPLKGVQKALWNKQ